MRLPISLGGTRGTVTPVSAKRKLDGDELLGAQLPRRPKIELDSEGEDEEDESVEEEKKLEEKPARTSLPTEIMDSQDEEEDEEWLEAVDLQSSTEPNTQQEEDDTEQLLRSMVEGDV